MLRRFLHIDAIPVDFAEWRIDVRNTSQLSRVLNEQRDLALLFRTLATLRTDAPLFKSVDELTWRGPTAEFARFAESITAPELVQRAERAAAS